MGADGCIKNPRRIKALNKSNSYQLKKTSLENLIFCILDKNPQQQKSIVVPTSQVNVMKKQRKTSTTVK